MQILQILKSGLRKITKPWPGSQVVQIVKPTKQPSVPARAAETIAHDITSTYPWARVKLSTEIVKVPDSTNGTVRLSIVIVDGEGADLVWACHRTGKDQPIYTVLAGNVVRHRGTIPFDARIEVSRYMQTIHTSLATK